MRRPSPKALALSTITVVWLGSVVAGMAALMDYTSRPGAPAGAAGDWPADSRLSRDTAGPTLVMLAHPRCDCTKASVSELAELLARAPHKPRVYVVFIKPGRTSATWEQTGLWASAAAIPSVTVVRDDDGLEAQRFRAQTSGQILLYGADGRLLYAGGTTAARGKVGDNAGREAILAALANPIPHASEPVFGCSLFGPADAPDSPGDSAVDSATHRHKARP